ncbi:zinc-finger homeodomain protein 5-like [Zingiber officinale]|uniref:zinc-finger homeodomain protein 5-like n=1 Tax=Zingiber officinale TaxID=94328 RepID=UPI001C4C6169|nr:zinc-finger homeodomain protein 5-like [Zingiber officinale]XP_042445814.1 zinc-finger homeodomain protein 5-like [Zingiber officinale]
MEFRHNNPNEIGIGSSSSTAYNSSLVRGGSAFSKPALSSSSSLVSPRAVPGGGGGGGGLRNGHVFGHAQTPPPSTLEMAPAVIDRALQSVAKNTDQSSVSNSPPPAGASGVAASASAKAKSSAEADVSAKYKECLRNHAAALGGHVLDGCGEFMPGGEPETADALRCAACGCHRSFHRREQDGGGGSSFFHCATRLPLLLPPPQAHSRHQKQFQFGGFPANPSPAAGMPGFVHFGGGGGNNPSGSGGTTTESSSEERIRTGTPTPAAAAMPRKRFRTKFSTEQKEKMLAFAERIGWRIQRQDDTMVQQFCAEIGVRRQVLKVWMHNNKHATVRKQQPTPTPPPPPLSPPPPKQEQQPMVQQSNHHPQLLQ